MSKLLHFSKEMILSFLGIFLISNGINSHSIASKKLIIPVTVTIELFEVNIEILNSLGNEWTHYGIVNNDTLNVGNQTVIKKTTNTPILIKSQSIEHDKHNDIGTDTFELLDFYSHDFSTTVNVKETHPNQYTSGTALITFAYKVSVN